MISPAVVGSIRSACISATFAPRPRSSSASACGPSSSARTETSRSYSCRWVKKISCPLPASARQIAAPIPIRRLAPVTIATGRACDCCISSSRFRSSPDTLTTATRESYREWVQLMVADLRSDFLLDPTVTFLNHGSFGACPKPVFAEYQRWQLELERQPVEFLGRRNDELLHDARAALGTYLNVDAD